MEMRLASITSDGSTLQEIAKAVREAEAMIREQRHALTSASAVLRINPKPDAIDVEALAEALAPIFKRKMEERA